MGDTNQTSILTSRVFLLIRIGLCLLHSVHSVVRDPHVGMGLTDEPGVGGLEGYHGTWEGRGGRWMVVSAVPSMKHASTSEEIVYEHQRYTSVQYQCSLPVFTTSVQYQCSLPVFNTITSQLHHNLNEFHIKSGNL